MLYVVEDDQDWTQNTLINMDDLLIKILGKGYDELAKNEFKLLMSSWELEKDEELNYFTIQSFSDGIEFALNKDKLLHSIFLQSADHEGYEQYRGSIPFGLSFDLSQKDVRNKMGAPTTTGGGSKSTVSRDVIPYWDRYDFPEFSFNVRYKSDKISIEVITISSTKVNAPM
jgi:hypothetical protein